MASTTLDGAETMDSTTFDVFYRGAFIPNAIDDLTACFPKLPNGVVPFLIFIPNTTTTSNISGTYIETQG